MKKIMKKLKRSGGFTLSETLVTVLILLMVAGVVAEGVPAAVTAFGKAIDAANAQVLISTTVNALRGELSTAKDVHLDSNSNPVYISPFTGSKTRLFRDENGVIMVQDFLKYDESGPQIDSVIPRELVTGSTKTKNLQVTYSSAGWEVENEVLVFSDLTVTKGTQTIADIDALYIRCLGVNMTEPGISP